MPREHLQLLHQRGSGKVLTVLSDLSTTHRWWKREVQIDHRTILHWHCKICGRDFTRPRTDSEWKAVHVGGLNFDLLDEETTQRWVSQDCPGRRLAGEANHERVQLRAPR
jgi:hypothetical protein